MFFIVVWNENNCVIVHCHCFISSQCLYKEYKWKRIKEKEKKKINHCKEREKKKKKKESQNIDHDRNDHEYTSVLYLKWANFISLLYSTE